jgi:hypothetical protein
MRRPEEVPATFRNHPRFLVPSGCSAAASVAIVVTLIWRDWIEIVFHVDPDRGSGALEWIVTAMLFAVALAGGVVARAERRRAAVDALEVMR